ncbi:MAG: GTPase Era [Acidobacteriota bacterium]
MSRGPEPAHHVDGAAADESPPCPAHRCGFVTLFGRSNVGKSTLLNRMVGRKVAIVTDVAQTTRNRVQGIRSYPDAQVIFMDTPGIHRPRFAMNRRMVAAALAGLEGMDILLVIIDGPAGLGPGDRYVMDLAARRCEPVFLVINKIDRMSRPSLLPLIARVTHDNEFAEVIPVSAQTGENIDRLEDRIRRILPVRAPLFPRDELTDAPERFLVAELLREQVIIHTRDELPHSTAVLVERFHETAAGRVELDTLVLVEKESQKAILIGRSGAMMKEIASAARLQMQALLHVPVMLNVWVKVAPRWRMDRRVLDQLGVDEASGKSHM